MKFSWLWIVWASLLAMGGVASAAPSSDRLTAARDLIVTLSSTMAVIYIANQSYRLPARIRAIRVRNRFPGSIVISAQLSAELAAALGRNTPSWGTCSAVVSADCIRVIVGTVHLREVGRIPTSAVQEVKISSARILGENSTAIGFVVPWSVLRFVPLATGSAIGPFASRAATERICTECSRMFA